MSDTKTLFKISELEELTGIPNTKIRYWTKKYKELNSQLRETPGSTHKLYHEDSIEIIITIDKYLKNLDILGRRETINLKLHNKINTQIKTIDKIKEIRDRLKNLLTTNV
jgi:DNA-binding transcriptional MerR regulator